MRLLLDTNVFLDVILKREPFNKLIRNFFVRAEENRDELYVCTSSLKDMSYFLHKYFHSNKKTNDVLINNYSHVAKVVGINTVETIVALYMDGDYEDNLIALTAETEMCDVIISRDKKLKNFRVVLSPEEYLKYRNQ